MNEDNTHIYSKDRGEIRKNVSRCYLILPLQLLEGSQLVTENTSHLTCSATDRLCLFPIQDYDMSNTFLATMVDIDQPN
jgi:hypothetical protein